VILPSSAARPLINPRRIDQARMLRASLACTLVNSSICYETDKKDVGVQRPPTALLLPIIANGKLGISV
jgi:hypothetical protein